MYKYSILLLLIFISGLVKSQNIYSALQLNEQRDYKARKPKKIAEYNTFYNPTGKTINKNIKTFDESGMLLIEERFNEAGALSAKLTYQNDTLRKLKLSRTFERWSRFGYSTEIANYEYSKKNALIIITDRDANGNLLRLSEITANDRGYPAALKTFDRNGAQFGTELATYFYNKNILVTTVIDLNDQVLSTDTSKISYINASKFPLQEEVYNSNGDLTYWLRKKADGSGNIKEREYT